MKYVNHDAFRRSGLGLTARRIWELLDGNADGLTVRQTASRLGINTSTVYRNLERLHGSRLVSRSRPVAVWRSMERDLDDVAGEHGTLGARDRQRKRHHREREGFALSGVMTGKDTDSDD